MHHLIGQQSLTSGWLPALAQLITLTGVVITVRWRARRWRTRWLPTATVLGGALAMAVNVYLSSIGVAGDPAPRRLWWWVGLTGFTLVIATAGWHGARWWRRGLGLACVPACALCAALVVNQWVGYFPTVHAAWSQLTVGPVADQTDRMTVTAMQLSGTRPSRGVVVPVTISAAASRFRHRDELVYLPPAWFAANPPPRLPVVMMIGAQLNTPADWLRAGGAVRTIDDFATAHGGNAPVFVFVDATGAFDNDTECVNGVRGNASFHLTKDVVPYMISNFNVSADRRNWGLVGWSMGGTCAVELAVRRPELFSTFVDIAGDLSPNSGTKAQTIARLFGGDSDAWAEFDPTTVITRHGHYSAVSGLFAVAASSDPSGSGGPDLANPEGQDQAAQTLCGVGSAHGIACSVLGLPGRHDWPFAAQAFAASLPWLAGQLGTADAPAIPIPGQPPARRVPVTTVSSLADPPAAKAAGG
ncbi:alpha/beta hydrolase [Mycolicibacterium sp. CH28]|uniref:alpha/beta hydrolase n=1 Tax=Mycolicibacterium sp. CH28 TaxID=2512237 RepID=UPI003511E68C